MKIHDALIVGCGGTGGYLAEPLARLLRYHPNAGGRLTFADGDTFDAGNATRQVFPAAALGRNKAQVTVERVAAALPEDAGAEPLVALPNYLNRMSAAGAIVGHTVRQAEARERTGGRPVLLIVCSVDNHATRHYLIDGATQAEDLDFLLLSPGNTLDRGQLLAWGRVAGQYTGPHPFDAHPELREPQDRMPGGCAQEAPSTPQLIGANMAAATLAVWAVQSWLDGSPIFDCTLFDCRRMEAAGIGQPVILEGGPLA